MTAVISPFPLPVRSSPVREPSSGGLPALPVSKSGVPINPPKILELPAMDSFSRKSHDSEPSGQPLPRLEAERPGDYTDTDLAEALMPLVAGGVAGIDFRNDPTFEAVLRATFRRALAEHSGTPFEAPGWRHQSLWRLQALFTSRSYEEVLADKIRRFQVEEVFLLDRDKLSLISYASCDPVRHAHARKVGSFARQLAMRIEIHESGFRPGFELGEGRRTSIVPGSYCLLVAVVRGEINDLVISDLDFALSRIESRYRESFEKGQPLLRELQPLLEECLLIHSPAGPLGS